MYLVAFAAGLVSFLSPCVLPLIPAFIGYLAGTHARKASRVVLFTHALLFVLGFGVVFATIGVALSMLLPISAAFVQLWLSRVAGVVVIAFGLHLTGLLHITFLERAHAIRAINVSNRHLMSFLFGASFAVGWTPCVSAVLGSILAVAVSMPGSAFGLLIAYSFGLGIPFLLAGLFADSFLRFISPFEKFLRHFNIIMGVVLIILGILIFTQKLTYAANIGFLLERFYE